MPASSINRLTPQIIVVQNESISPCGHFCRRIQDMGASVIVVKPYESEALHIDVSNFDGLVVLGGSQHADDDCAAPYFEALMDLMRRFNQQYQPVIGICLGCQLLARAHGGDIRPLNTLEFGFIQLGLTDQGGNDPVIGGISLPALMQFHEDTFDLPETAALLIEGDACRNQAFKVGNVSYGFQPHIEVDYAIAHQWIEEFRTNKADHYGKYRHHFTRNDFDSLNTKLHAFILESQHYCDHVAENWLALLKTLK